MFDNAVVGSFTSSEECFILHWLGNSILGSVLEQDGLEVTAVDKADFKI